MPVTLVRHAFLTPSPPRTVCSPGLPREVMFKYQQPSTRFPGSHRASSHTQRAQWNQAPCYAQCGCVGSKQVKGARGSEAAARPTGRGQEGLALRAARCDRAQTQCRSWRNSRSQRETPVARRWDPPLEPQRALGIRQNTGHQAALLCNWQEGGCVAGVSLSKVQSACPSGVLPIIFKVLYLFI